MADLTRTLKKSYLREARIGRATAALQLAWLEEQRVLLQAEVSKGDWAVTGESMEGGSRNAARAITAADRLTALLAAIEDLENSSGAAVNKNRPGLFTPIFNGGIHT